MTKPDWVPSGTAIGDLEFHYVGKDENPQVQGSLILLRFVAITQDGKMEVHEAGLERPVAEAMLQQLREIAARPDRNSVPIELDLHNQEGQPIRYSRSHNQDQIKEWIQALERVLAEMA